MIKFFGRGCAFADEHNSAFFYHDKDLILIDCPATSFQKIKKMNLHKIQNIYILVTHTHGDHTGSVGTILQYAWFILKNPVTIVAPSDEVKNDLQTLLIQIEGCEPKWFNITTADKIRQNWLVSAIPTTHSKTLAGKCFGYHLKIQGNDVIYTGDTATLSPYLPFLHDGAYLYTEISFYKSDVHLHIDDALPILKKLSENGVKIYLMHLDDENEILKIIYDTKLKFAPLSE